MCYYYLFSFFSPGPTIGNDTDTHSPDMNEIGNTLERKDPTPDIYATIGRSKVSPRRQEHCEFDPYESIQCNQDLLSMEPKDERKGETKEDVYESLGNCINEQQWLPSEKLCDSNRVIISKAIKNAEPYCEPLMRNCDLYAKVNKISSGPNFVSIYDLTKVDLNANPAEDVQPDLPLSTRDQMQHKGGSDFNIVEALNKSKLNHSFALDFSKDSKRFPDTSKDKGEDSEDELRRENEDTDSEISKLSDCPETIKDISVERDPIPKMNINMFIQKDAKENVRRWPKVETQQTPKKTKATSPTMQLIGKFNNGLNQPVKARPQNHKVKTPTKLLINKFNNTNDVNKSPVHVGFQGINSLTNSSKKMPSKSPVPLPRSQNMTRPSQVQKLVTALSKPSSLPGEEEEGSRVSILKRNCGLHGWQAADV